MTGEGPLAEQAVNLRWRDGSLYQSMPTDAEGFVPFDQMFPFFHWLVAEVDYTRLQAHRSDRDRGQWWRRFDHRLRFQPADAGRRLHRSKLHLAYRGRSRPDTGRAGLPRPDQRLRLGQGPV